MYRKFKNPKISYICDKTLVLPVICDMCGSKDGESLKKKDQLSIIKRYRFD